MTSATWRICKRHCLKYNWPAMDRETNRVRRWKRIKPLNVRIFKVFFYSVNRTIFLKKGTFFPQKKHKLSSWKTSFFHQMNNLGMIALKRKLKRIRENKESLNWRRSFELKSVLMKNDNCLPQKTEYTPIGICAIFSNVWC